MSHTYLTDPPLHRLVPIQPRKLPATPTPTRALLAECVYRSAFCSSSLVPYQLLQISLPPTMRHLQLLSVLARIFGQMCARRFRTRRVQLRPLTREVARIDGRILGPAAALHIQAGRQALDRRIWCGGAEERAGDFRRLVFPQDWGDDTVDRR